MDQTLQTLENLHYGVGSFKDMAALKSCYNISYNKSSYVVDSQIMKLPIQNNTRIKKSWKISPDTAKSSPARHTINMGSFLSSQESHLKVER